MGSLNGRVRRLESSIPPGDLATDEAADMRRTEIIAEFERFERWLGSMSPEEHKAWRESPETRESIEALEAEIRRRQKGLSA